MSPFKCIDCPKKVEVPPFFGNTTGGILWVYFKGGVITKSLIDTAKEKNSDGLFFNDQKTFYPPHLGFVTAQHVGSFDIKWQWFIVEIRASIIIHKKDHITV